MVRVGWQVKLCDPLVTRGSYLSALEIRSLYIKRYINSPSLLLLLYLSITALTLTLTLILPLNKSAERTRLLFLHTQQLRFTVSDIHRD